MKLRFGALTLLILFFCFTVNAQSGRKTNQPKESPSQNIGNQEQQNEEKRGESKPVKIIRKPVPDASVAAECHRKEALTYMQAVLRVTFDASGVISDVEIKTASGCREFDEESVDAARRIKFEPAVQDGKPISVSKTIVYAGGMR